MTNIEAAAALKANHLEVYYDGIVLALRDLSLQVPERAIVALLGANGAGKSTTLKTLSGLLRADRGAVTNGSIEVFGEDATDKNSPDLVEDGLVLVMEGRRCFPHLTVEENLTVGAYSRRIGRVQTRHELEKIYAYFPRLKDRRHLQAGYTSGGEQQMCAIGRALMTSPRLVLLDEPSMGLAPIIVEEIFNIIEAIRREQGVSLLIAEQNSNLALRHADYGYVLDSGRVTLEGSASELRSREDVKAAYLGSQERQQFRSMRSVKPRRRWRAGP